MKNGDENLVPILFLLQNPGDILFLAVEFLVPTLSILNDSENLVYSGILELEGISDVQKFNSFIL